MSVERDFQTLYSLYLSFSFAIIVIWRSSFANRCDAIESVVGFYLINSAGESENHSRENTKQIFFYQKSIEKCEIVFKTKVQSVENRIVINMEQSNIVKDP